MGLLGTLLTLPLAPLRGTVAVAEQVLAQAEEAYYDPISIRNELDEVERLRQAGALDEEAAVAWEEELIERLLVGQERGSHG